MDSLCLTDRLVDVYRYNPNNIAEETWVSSHRYDKNDRVIAYFLYDDKGSLAESLTSDGYIETRTDNTYEGDFLVKSVVSRGEGFVTTYEYRYANGTLQTIHVTQVYANGDTYTWEQTPPPPPATPN